jgi:hypothetical protein
MHQNCFICQKYLNKEGQTEYNQTTFQCISHNLSCIEEHMISTCDIVGCFGSDRSYSHFPREHQVQLVSVRITHSM